MKYLFLFVGKEFKPDESVDKQEHAAKWMQYMSGLMQQGKLEGGLPLTWNAKQVTKNGVLDRQLKDVDIGGYMIVHADSYEEACEIAKGAPNVTLGGSVIVRECQDIPM